MAFWASSQGCGLLFYLLAGSKAWNDVGSGSGSDMGEQFLGSEHVVLLLFLEFSDFMFYRDLGFRPVCVAFCLFWGGSLMT